MEMHTAYIGLGGNLGDRKETIETAVKMLAENEHIEFVGVSELVETAPLGGADQPDYLNAVAELQTSLNPGALHQVLIEIENQLGRKRDEKWSPRAIDLDLLLFDDMIINAPELTVPHPQMHLRSFVLSGLCRFNPKLIHPVLKVTVKELAARLNGGDFVTEPDKPQLISIAGNIGVGKTTLANKLPDYFGCDIIFEPYDENPFMPDVYAGKKELALDSQLFFLTGRVEQLDRKKLSPGTIYISDYVFDKELIYARALLSPRQLAIYEGIYEPFAAKISPPVLVIYMQDSPQSCLERIHSRNRPYEQQIDLDFLRRLDCDYEKLFIDWKLSPVIRVSTTQLDYNDNTCLEHIVNQIKCYVTDKRHSACGSAASEM
ncbi:MAG: 2-amino-4-hydroxy-6-hydroxymethyldihydropteridine diphosphokinase [Sedimentisphaerales bacterium]|nr:2-amino-4-hydroxy-6-hydroxymethyldihydropteridine diphosphokinase [Sedimentisphaerales bacterium]